MTIQGAQREELVELLGLLRDGPLSVGQAARLDELVCGDEAACTFYVCYAHMHTGLRYYTGKFSEHSLLSNFHPSATEQQSQPNLPVLGFLADSARWTREYFSQPGPLSILAAAIFMVCLISILSILPAPTYERSRFNHVCTTTTSSTGLRGVDGKFKFVARITGLHNCRWADNYLPPLRYAHLGLGRELKLDSGLVEITYYNGAKLVLEGPVEFTVEQKNTCRLEVGKLAAKVPKPAIGFTIDTPTAKIVDLGTELVVEINERGVSEVDVFKGKVTFQGVSGGRLVGKKVRLSAGQSARCDPTGTNIQLGTGGAKAFVGSMPPQTTVAYWRFERGAADTVMPGTNGKTMCRPAVVDCSGNGNTLYAFNEADAGHIWRSSVPAASVPNSGEANTLSAENNGDLPGLFTWSSRNSSSGTDIQTITPKQWTIEASFMPESLSGYQGIVGRDGRDVTTEKGTLAPLYFQTIDGSLAVKFADINGNWHQAQTAADTLVAGQWHHAAAVSDGSTLRLYLNDGSGYRLVASTALGAGNTEMAKENDKRCWSVGRGFYNGKDADRFDGYIDEVRISSIALKPTQFLFAPPSTATASSSEKEGGPNNMD